jgi:hypothetical protein
VCGNYTFYPYSCHVRLCPDCERARSARLVGRYDEIASQMASPRLWTLTLPNVAPGALRSSLGVLIDALAHLRRRAIFTGGPCRGGHQAVAYDDVDAALHVASGEEASPCAHPPHRRELAAVGSCRCARCLEVDVVRAGQKVTVNGCPRCHHEAVAGGVYSVEVTWSPWRPVTHPWGYKEVADWHPHAHLLMDAPYILWAEMRDAWRAVSCDAIRRAEPTKKGAFTRNKGRIAKCPHLADDRGIATAGCRGASIVLVKSVQGEPGSPERRKAVSETLKYLSKGLLDADGHLLPGASGLELAELLLAIRGRRLVAGWGSLRNVHDDEDDDQAADVVPLWTAEKDRNGDAVVIMMPRICPACGSEAMWEPPITVRRTACRRLASGVLIWRPPKPVPPRPADPLAWIDSLVAWDLERAWHD